MILGWLILRRVLSCVDAYTRVGKRRRKLKRRTPRVRRGTARQENFEKVPPQTFFKCKKTSHCGKNEVRFTKVQPYLAESKVRATKNKPCFTKKTLQVSSFDDFKK